MDFTQLHNRAADKTAWRAAFREARRQLTRQDMARQNAALTRRMLELPELDGAGVVHVFWPMTDAGEVDTRPLIEALQAQGKQIVLPVVLSYSDWSPDTSRMEHRLFTGETNLQPNRWGTYEPVDGALVSADRLEAIIVPALGIDRTGQRIGYGKGYYDELLSQSRATSVCPIWTSFLVERLPATPHDAPVDVIVSESTILRPRASHVT